MKYFGIREIVPCVDGHCRDGRCGVSESTIVKVPGDVIENAIALVENVLDPARKAYGKPIRVNSGYRCPLKNKAVGGVALSQHLKGEAADIAPAGFRIQVPGFKRELNAMAAILVEQGRFDQLILYPTFLHVSYKRSGRNRGQILRKVSGGYRLMTRKEVLSYDD